MRLLAVALALAACSGRPGTTASAAAAPRAPAPGTADDAGVGAVAAIDAGSPSAADAGAASADAGAAASADAGPAASADAGTLCYAWPDAAADAGPADAGLSYAPGAVAAAATQASQWSATGAAGCDGLVPSSVPPRMSFTAPGDCRSTSAALDGEGNLVASWSTTRFGEDVQRAYFPAGGGAGQIVSSREVFVASRERGFLLSPLDRPAGAEWVRAVAPDGSDEGFVGAPLPAWDASLWPDPRGGNIETRVTSLICGDGPRVYTWELRWLDADLQPRTPWWKVTSWDYDYNVGAQVLAGASGDALVLIFFDPPMSMPCHGDLSFNAWVSEGGKVTPLQTPTPSVTTDLCSAPQGGTYGWPLALDDGFAFYFSPASHFPVQGWWIRFRSGETTGEAPPAWLSGQDYFGLQALANGAYLRVTSDPATCARTANLLGPSGQLCATLPLDGSADCGGVDHLSRDGTLVIRDGCDVAWWPGLARP